MAEKLRQQYIRTIMRDKFGDDDPKNDQRNWAFLESLTLEELEDLSEVIIDEDDLED